jgi:hypothetical protein
MLDKSSRQVFPHFDPSIVGALGDGLYRQAGLTLTASAPGEWTARSEPRYLCQYLTRVRVVALQRGMEVEVLHTIEYGPNAIAVFVVGTLCCIVPAGVLLALVYVDFDSWSTAASRAMWGRAGVDPVVRSV